MPFVRDCSLFIFIQPLHPTMPVFTEFQQKLSFMTAMCYLPRKTLFVFCLTGECQTCLEIKCRFALATKFSISSIFVPKTSLLPLNRAILQKDLHCFQSIILIRPQCTYRLMWGLGEKNPQLLD